MAEYKMDCRSDQLESFESTGWTKIKYGLYRCAGSTSWTWSARVSFGNRILCNNRAEITTSPDVRLSHLQLPSIFINVTFVFSVSVIKAAVWPRWCSLTALRSQIIAGGKVWRSTQPRLACWLMPPTVTSLRKRRRKALFLRQLHSNGEVTRQLSTFDRHIKLQTGL